MSSRRLAAFLLACAFGWSLAVAALLLVSNGLLASYDFPGHLHLSAVQMRSPNVLWDDSWYAGYPTYAYPPLAHRIAGEFMQRLGVERGFKAAVSIAYLASVPAVYAAGRLVAGLPAVPAAAATLVVLVAPTLFRAFLFGQYPSLIGYSLFLGALAALFATLQAQRRVALLGLLASLLVAALGSTHLYALMLLLVVLVPLLFTVNIRLLAARVALPVFGGVILAALPSLLLLSDLNLLSKTPVPHITRSVEMINPAGLLNWLLYPAGLPLIAGTLVLGAVLIGGTGWTWIGVGLVGGLVLYLRGELGIPVAALVVLCASVFGYVLSRYGAALDWRSRYLMLAGLICVWLALGPAGGLARILPFSDVLVYDRPLLYGAPLVWLALARVLWGCVFPMPWRKVIPALLLVTAGPLFLFSVTHVLRTYAWLVPGAGGSIPQGTPLHAGYAEFLGRQRVTGRLLPLGFPPIAYTLPDAVDVPLIDGAYNDARVLDPFRRSGLESLGSEKFTNRDLRVTRFFLANADKYGIEWVMTADRYYDSAIPRDRFRLVYDSPSDMNGAVRIYKSVFAPGKAWVGEPQYSESEIAQVPINDVTWGTGGGARSLIVDGQGATVDVGFKGSQERGWAIAEVALPRPTGPCTHLVVDSWSPTGAALTVRVYRDGEYRMLYPETSLSSYRSSISVAVDCARVDRVHFAISGPGDQRAFVGPVSLQFVEDATSWVPFQRTSAECFRVSIPDSGARVTASVPYYPRWEAMESRQRVTLGSDALGLLTLGGKPGLQTICLSFPTVFRWARANLPTTYVALSALIGVVIASSRLPARMPGQAGVVFFLGVLTAIREVVTRHRVHPEEAWDQRAREAPDWYATFTKGRAHSEGLPLWDLRLVLQGVDRSQLKQAVVLDVGCGPGRMLESFATLAAEAYGVDISNEMVKLAQVRLRGISNVTILKNDGHSLSMFSDDKFDFVYSVNVFQHIPYRVWIEEYLQEIYRVLRPGGDATIQVDGRAGSMVWRLAKSIVGHDSWAGIILTRHDWVQTALRYGFKVNAHEYSSGGIRWKGQGLWLHLRKPLSVVPRAT